MKVDILGDFYNIQVLEKIEIFYKCTHEVKVLLVFIYVFGGYGELVDNERYQPSDQVPSPVTAVNK